MKRLLLALTVMLSSCCSLAFAQVELTVTKIDVVKGLINPKVMKDGTVIVGANSTSSFEKAALIEVTGPESVLAKGYDMEAEKKPSDDLVSLIEDSPNAFVLTGTGSYKVRWYGQDPVTGRSLRKRVDIDLGPPPPPLKIEIVFADIIASKDVALTPLQPVKAVGGKGLLQYSVEPQPPIGLLFNTDGFVSGTPTLPQQARPYNVTVKDEAGQSQAGFFNITVSDLPPIPADAWDNVGQRAFKAAQGLARAKDVAALYRACQKDVAEALDPSMNASLAKMVSTRNTMLTPAEQASWKPVVDLVTAQMQKSWPMDRQTLADYLGTIASALERLK